MNFIKKFFSIFNGWFWIFVCSMCIWIQIADMLDKKQISIWFVGILVGAFLIWAISLIKWVGDSIEVILKDD